MKLYKDLTDEGIIEKVPENVHYDWISPSCIVVKPNSTPSNPKLRLVSEMRSLNLAAERKNQPFPDLKTISARIPPNTRILGK